MSIRFAITSTDGVTVNKQFEIADTFFIYEIVDNNKVFVEKRNVERYSATTNNVRFKRNRFKTIYESLKDCKTLITNSIELETMEKIKEYGIDIKTDTGYIASLAI